MKKMRLRVRKNLWLHGQLWTSVGSCPKWRLRCPPCLTEVQVLLRNQIMPKKDQRGWWLLWDHMYNTKRRLFNSSITCYLYAWHCAKHLLCTISFNPFYGYMLVCTVPFTEVVSEAEITGVTCLRVGGRQRSWDLNLG